MSALCRSSSRRLPRQLFAAMHRRYTLDVAAPLLRTQSYVDGRWVSAASEFPVLDPCSGQEIARVSNCGPAEARTAVAAASEAFQSWKQTTAKVRCCLCNALRAAHAHTHGRRLRFWSQLTCAWAPAGEERAAAEVVRPDAAAQGPAGAPDHLRVREYFSMLTS